MIVQVMERKFATQMSSISMQNKSNSKHTVFVSIWTHGLIFGNLVHFGIPESFFFSTQEHMRVICGKIFKSLYDSVLEVFLI